MVEPELFAQAYKSYGLATVRYPVLEITATVEPFGNGRGFSLCVLRAGVKPVLTVVLTVVPSSSKSSSKMIVRNTDVLVDSYWIDFEKLSYQRRKALKY
jgi:hypothetical protein